MYIYIDNVFYIKCLMYLSFKKFMLISFELVLILSPNPTKMIVVYFIVWAILKICLPFLDQLKKKCQT